MSFEMDFTTVKCIVCNFEVFKWGNHDFKVSTLAIKSQFELSQYT